MKTVWEQGYFIWGQGLAVSALIAALLFGASTPFAKLLSCSFCSAFCANRHGLPGWLASHRHW